VCDIRPEAREKFASYFPDADFAITPYASIEEACRDSDVIITLGARGAYVLSGSGSELIPGYPARVVDTIGAGDAHIGSIMAAEAEGRSLPEAVRRANRISAAVVAQTGAELSLTNYLHAMEE